WLRADGAHLLHLFVAQLGEERLDAREALLQLLGRAGVGNAQRPRLAECGARHRRDELVFQQRLAEIDVVFDRLAVVRLAERDRDVRERVERALWTRALHAGNREQRVDHIVAALREILALGVRHILRTGQGRDRGL